MTTTNCARRLAGKRGQSAGAAFEERIKAWHRTAGFVGFAYVRHIDPPFRYDRGTWKPAGRSGADYLGNFGPKSGLPPIAFAMEAKCTAKEEPSLSIYNRDLKKNAGGGLGAHQLRDLDLGWEKFRRPGFVLWLNGGRLLILPPSRVRVASERYTLHLDGDRTGRASIPAAEFEAIVGGDWGWLGWAADWVKNNGPATGEEAA